MFLHGERKERAFCLGELWDLALVGFELGVRSECFQLPRCFFLAFLFERQVHIMPTHGWVAEMRL